MAPLKKKRVRGGENAIDAMGGSKSLLALEDDDQKDFERRVADHKKKVNSGVGGSKTTGSNIPGVVYLGHVPHGFYEKEMRAFFSQFGAVTRLRLSRSKRTGRSKGMSSEEIDSLVYCLLVCHVIVVCHLYRPFHIHLNLAISYSS